MTGTGSYTETWTRTSCVDGVTDYGGVTIVSFAHVLAKVSQHLPFLFTYCEGGARGWRGSTTTTPRPRRSGFTAAVTKRMQTEEMRRGTEGGGLLIRRLEEEHRDGGGMAGGERLKMSRDSDA